MGFCKPKRHGPDTKAIAQCAECARLLREDALCVRLAMSDQPEKADALLAEIGKSLEAHQAVCDLSLFLENVTGNGP